VTSAHRLCRSDISVTETITETEIIGPMLTKTMCIRKMKIILKIKMDAYKTYKKEKVYSVNGNETWMTVITETIT